jgi:hypothetical protein
VEDIERGAALERELVVKHQIVRDLLQQIQESQHFFQRAGLMARVGRKAL